MVMPVSFTLALHSVPITEGRCTASHPANGHLCAGVRAPSGCTQQVLNAWGIKQNDKEEMFKVPVFLKASW